jgi:hypothetical protein
MIGIEGLPGERQPAGSDRQRGRDLVTVRTW